MSDWGILVPIVAIASGPIGWAANTWIRARHGYALANRKGEVQENDLPLTERRRLTTENEAQREQIAALHQRLAVLERIATDPGARVSSEIDALRLEKAR